MSDNNIWEDDENNATDQSGGNLRKQLEKALADLKTAQAEKAKLQTSITERDASEVLKAKGYDPKVGRLAAKDGVDVSDDKALDKWLEDNPVFVKTNAEQTAEGEQPSGEVPGTQEVAGYTDTFSAISQIHSAAAPALTNRYQAAAAGLKADATTEEVLAAFAGL